MYRFLLEKVATRTLLPCQQKNNHHYFNNSNRISKYWSSTSSFTTSIDNNPNSPLTVLPAESKRTFKKILVANRGEIACRIIRTAQRLGIQTVAVYSNVDGPHCLHAKMADEAYLIGNGPSPSESYLRASEVLEIAQMTGSEAIHPGYGFLSENSSFATAVQQCNHGTNRTSGSSSLTFIGPPPSAILAMGSKSHSKAIMEDANVPTTPGYHDDNQDPEYLLHQAVHNVGFPLLIKATMGGGGKGMRLVWNEAEFLSSLESCKRESQASFGDANVILERYLIHPRHIEIQVMADTHGNAVYLHERDCSLQRRHQKIIEEAPASDLPPHVRELMGQTAVNAAKAVGYVNAGTVEFLLDSSGKSGSSTDHDFYFCEMNTRLQVEHPVTEMITGQDLVEWQLRIAAGEELPIKDQSQIPCMGHSMEARIYAENPLNDFLPAIGHVWHHNPPMCATPLGKDVEGGVGVGNTVRVDTGLEAGRDITVYYDPMVSKLIVHGPNREEARLQLVQSLRDYQISGVPSNIPFLIRCAQHPIFSKAGAVNTGFLEDFMDDVNKVNDVTAANTVELQEQQAVCAFIALLVLEGRFGQKKSAFSTQRQQSTGGPWSQNSGSWRLGTKYQRILKETKSENELHCISNRDGSFEISTPLEPKEEQEEEDVAANENVINTSLVVDGVFGDKNNRLDVVINGIKKKSYTAVAREDIDAGTITVDVWPILLQPTAADIDDSGNNAISMTFQHPISLVDQNHANDASGMSNSSSSTSSNLHAPMPGKITRLNWKEGDFVNENDTVIVMEAMKMEHAIVANRSGIVSSFNYNVGDIVNDGDVLAVVTEELEDRRYEA